MTGKLNRRDFAKATGSAVAVAAAALSIESTPAKAEENKNVSKSKEFVPGMAAQGKGIKCYVESDYAPLKACLVGNPSAIMVPDPDTYEMANLFAHETDEFNAYLRKHKGTNLRDSDPKTWEKMAMESDALAKAYRDNGVRIIRNESGETPEGVINYNLGWSKQKNMSVYGQSAFEVFGHCLVQFMEVSCSQTEIVHREAMIEIFKNDPKAVWLTMPPCTPPSNSECRVPF